MDNEIMTKIKSLAGKKRPQIHVGDTVKLHMRINEGADERTQIFEGVVIALKGKGVNQTITVRKISLGVGVERIVPLQSPTLSKVEVVKRGNKIRKSKLYYMRDRVGKRAMKVRGGTQDVYHTDEEVEVADVAVEGSTDNTDVVEEDTTKSE